MTALMTPLSSLLLLAAALGAGGHDSSGKPIPALAGPGDPNLVEGSFRISRAGQPEIWVPPGEVLEFLVDVDLGILGEASVGTVTMSSGVEPFVSGMPTPGQTLSSDGAMVGWVRSVARGGHLGYELDHSISTRFLPQEWPSLLNLEVQKGSENRKRELKIGVQDGAWVGTYRGNSHCKGCERREHFVEAALPWNDAYHCKKCKRAEHRHWDVPKERAVPAQTVDVLGAVYLARTLVRDGLDELELQMLQKGNLWDVKLTRGVVATIRTSAGKFRCREVVLGVSVPEGEEGASSKFSGLFGIKGSIQIWVQESTGVPVLIEGDVPLGSIMDLHARVKLSSYLGTPSAFQPE
jgi:hypothetical protein